MIYKVKVFTDKYFYEEFLNDHPDINIVSVNITSYVYEGVQTRIYLTYCENEGD